MTLNEPGNPEVVAVNIGIAVLTKVGSMGGGSSVRVDNKEVVAIER